jgi:hypothetical protein
LDYLETIGVLPGISFLAEPFLYGLYGIGASIGRIGKGNVLYCAIGIHGRAGVHGISSKFEITILIC